MARERLGMAVAISKRNGTVQAHAHNLPLQIIFNLDMSDVPVLAGLWAFSILNLLKWEEPCVQLPWVR